MKRILLTAAAILAAAVIAATLYVYHSVHFYDSEEVHRAAPTCTTPGYEYRICRICGKIELCGEIPPTDHTYSEWTTLTPAELLSVGTEISRCENCGLIQKRDTLPLIDSIMPRLEFVCSASGISTTSAISAELHVSAADVSASGGCALFYLPPEDCTPHDYAFFVQQTDDSLAAVLPDANDPDVLYHLYANRIDPLHIRRLAAKQLFRDAVSASGNTVYLSLLSTDSGFPYGGFPVAFYQNGQFLEPRILSLAPEAFCADSGAIEYAVMANGGELRGVCGENADELFLRDSAAGDAAFDDDAIMTYLAFCDLLKLDGAKSDNLLFVRASNGLWYPLPLSFEPCFGITEESPGLCAPNETVREAEDTAFDGFWQENIQRLSYRIGRRTQLLKESVLSPDAVGIGLRAASDNIPQELIRKSRYGNAALRLAVGGSTEDILQWYRSRADLT